MRYFHWGIARLILEADPCPDVVPMWVDGLDKVMPEDRQWPRFIPRLFKPISVTFGDRVSPEMFEPLRQRWKALVQKHSSKAATEKLALGADREGGVLLRKEDAEVALDPGVLSEELMYDRDAVKLREECTLMIRNEVLKIRRSRGLPDEDPKVGRVETWIEEGKPQKKEGRMPGDGSLIGPT